MGNQYRITASSVRSNRSRLTAGRGQCSGSPGREKIDGPRGDPCPKKAAAGVQIQAGVLGGGQRSPGIVLFAVEALSRAGAEEATVLPYNRLLTKCRQELLGAVIYHRVYIFLRWRRH